MKRFSRNLLLLLILSAMFAGIYVWQIRPRLPQHTGPTPETYTLASSPAISLDDVQGLTGLSSQYAALVKAVTPSVVSIRSMRSVPEGRGLIFRDPTGRFFQFQPQMPEMQRALGSGVVVSNEGHIVTNHHVVNGMDEIEVRLTDGTSQRARMIGSDPLTDIAVLKIEANGLKPLTFADSETVAVGEMVFAIGNPFGFEGTVTRGIISAKGRTGQRDNISEFLQTDAAINPGNSGGPLINMRGEIVGINTQIFSETGGWMGVGFAVPANTAKQALESVLTHGRIQRGYLGVVVEPWTEELLKHFNLTKPEGLLVVEVVPGSPADRAGIEKGDILSQYNGRKLETFVTLQNLVIGSGVGKEAKIVVLRDGQAMNLTAVIEEPKENLSAAAPGSPPTLQAFPPGGAEDATPAGPLAGVSVEDLTETTRRRLGIGNDVNGVVVTRIQPGAKAAQRLQVDDIIQEIGGKPVMTRDQFLQTASALPAEDSVMLFIQREKAKAFAVIPAAE